MSRIEYANTLRDLGYAVVVFSPEELDGCKPDDLEDSLISYAWEAIDALNRAEVSDGS